VSLHADALTDVAAMQRFLDRTSLSGGQQTVDIDWLEDLINAYSPACARWANRQFTPERVPANGQPPLLDDDLALDVARLFDYDGDGVLDLAPYEVRNVTEVRVHADLPAGQQRVLFAGDGGRAAEYRLEPAPRTTEGTWLWLRIPRRRRCEWAQAQVQVTGDWGAPPGAASGDIAHACKIAVGQAYRNPEEYQRRLAAGEELDIGTEDIMDALPMSSRALLTPYRQAR
jgi:hypothetical protein